MDNCLNRLPFDVFENPSVSYSCSGSNSALMLNLFSKPVAVVCIRYFSLCVCVRMCENGPLHQCVQTVSLSPVLQGQFFKVWNFKLLFAARQLSRSLVRDT